jgi:hypothetical protein
MKTKWISFGLALTMMTGSGVFLVRLKTTQKLGRPGVKLELPGQPAGFTSEPLAVTDIEIATLPRDTTFGRRLYSQVQNGQTNQIMLGIVLMGADRTSLHTPQICLAGLGWRIDKTELITVPIDRPHPYALPVMKLTASKELTSPDGRRLTLPDGRTATWSGVYMYWFVAENSLTANHWERMWRMSKNLLLTGTLQRWAYVNCFATCAPGQEDTTAARMQQLIADAVPEFQLATGPVRTAAR